MGGLPQPLLIDNRLQSGHTASVTPHQRNLDFIRLRLLHGLTLQQIGDGAGMTRQGVGQAIKYQLAQIARYRARFDDETVRRYYELTEPEWDKIKLHLPKEVTA